MKADIQRQWIEALESGRYKFGKGALHFNGRFCGGGVLCDVMGMKWEYFDGERMRGIWRGDDKRPWYAQVPPEVLAEAGITDQQEADLYAANDDAETRDFGPVIELVKSWPAK